MRPTLPNFWREAVAKIGASETGTAASGAPSVKTVATRASASSAYGVAALLLAFAAPSGAWAMEEGAGEKKAIHACERRLCTILLQKSPKGDDLKCELAKTWARSTIKEADSHKLSWGFGDARCSVKLHISRALIVAALTSPTYKLFVPPHTAHCVVEEDGKPQLLTATLSPKIVFKGGRAEKIWINLVSVEGTASIKGTITLAAQLTDSIGIFHRPMIKAVNRFIDKTCPTKYPQAVAATPAPPAKK